ncbi:Outer membrane protein TolC [Flavobacterium glycines]|uniref:Outer membrane protein TolC n=1 Tax=Flavobacterium glycines TaxID=551990 RepID=A0A1B9DKW9_9FLAO|nr:TolC family protein [Flavobacterium glycines]OCB70352.1 transporter [Flavobacterium glycines]GEL11603.1 transporter [Flavobacterium glycines]SDJ73263.1 Outer membrane protein TolC [Flavobacterium glycines]
MKANHLILFGTILLGISSVEAQEKKSLSLDEAVHLAWDKSNEVNLANAKVATKKYELQSVKNHIYPDLKASAQYQRLTKASVNLKSNSSDSGSDSKAPNVDQLVLGQITANLPIFSGFKLQNSIKVSDNLYQAETANALQTKEETAMKVINYYAALYKAQKTVELLNENYKSAQQRVKDFTELEKNEIVPKNDLLKTQLQLSKVQLSLDKAKSDLSVINYELTNLLKLDPKTIIEIRESDFYNFETNNVPVDENPALENRKDLEALRFEEKASQAHIKVARSGYYPSLSLIGGYTTLDLKNVVTVQNAMNFGVGLSYNISDIFKNGTEVKIAKSKAAEVQNSEMLLTDYIKIQVQQAIEEYDLAQKQNLVYTQAVDQATENYRMIKDKYDNGLSDTNDLLEADVEQLSAKINKALAKANIIQKYYNLLSVTGQLNQTFKL